MRIGIREKKKDKACSNQVTRCLYRYPSTTENTYLHQRHPGMYA